jgi:hypothetical protein
MNGGLINRLALVEAFREPKIGSGEIKPTTWPRRYVRRMQLSLGAGDRSPPKWRYAFQLLSAHGLRPEELQHREVRNGRLWGNASWSCGIATKNRTRSWFSISAAMPVHMGPYALQVSRFSRRLAEPCSPSRVAQANDSG